MMNEIYSTLDTHMANHEDNSCWQVVYQMCCPLCLEENISCNYTPSF